MDDLSPVLRVCSLLNKHRAEYLVIGARACILHGYVHTTEDVDILVPEDLSNHIWIFPRLSRPS